MHTRRRDARRDRPTDTPSAAGRSPSLAGTPIRSEQELQEASSKRHTIRLELGREAVSLPPAPAKPRGRGRPAAQTDRWHSVVADHVQEIAIILTDLWMDEHPTTPIQVSEAVDSVLDRLAEKRLEDQRQRLQLFAKTPEERWFFVERIEWLQRLIELRRRGEVVAGAGSMVQQRAEGWLLWRLQSPDYRAQAERMLSGVLKRGASNTGRRGLDPETAARHLVAVAWAVSEASVRRAVRAYRKTMTRNFARFAIIDALAVLIVRNVAAVPLQRLLLELKELEEARRNRLRRRQRRQSIVWRWVSTWKLPCTVEELCPLLEEVGVPVEEAQAKLEIPVGAFTPSVVHWLRQCHANGIAEYRAEQLSEF